MPQIDQVSTIYASQLLWLLLVFAIIYVVIGKGMLPRIEGTIHARNDKIAGDLAAAQKARDEAEAVETTYRAEMDAAHQSAHGSIQAAKDEATREAEDRLKQTHDMLAARIASAEADLSAARTRALAEIEGVATEAVRDIVQRLSGIEIAPEEAARAVRANLAGA